MFISKNEAEGFIKKFLEIKENLAAGLPANLDPVPNNYYTNSQQSFIFRREFIDGLFEGVDANALRVYYAAHDDGEPTLVLVACKVNDDDTLAENRMASAADRAGSQHPKPKTDTGGFTKETFDLDADSVNTELL